MELVGGVAIVTGGARGIGRGTALELAHAGCDVVIGDLLALPEIARDAAETVAAVEAAGRRALAVSCDVAVARECDALVATARAELGRLDVVVCNAGIMHLGGVAETTSEQWKKVLDVNLTGVFHTCKAALPHLTAQGRGSIVNIASAAGLRTGPGRVAYSASKFGVVGLTQSLAAEVAQDGVRVNCVCPSFTRSHMSIQELMEQTGIDDFARADAVWTKVGAKRLPVGRSVEPADIGRAVVWLCQADTVVGIALPVTGGEGLPVR